MNQRIRGFFRYVSVNPILSTTIVFVIACIIVFSVSFPYFHYDPEEYVKGIIIEANGMLFDIAIIGILILWLNKSGEKHVRIQKSQDEIDDIRFWKSPEASYKILGNIKRLVRDKIYKLDLNNCYLKSINLNFVNLQGSNINYGDLSHTSLIETNFEGARLNQTNFENGNLNRTNFKGSLMSGANLTKVKGIKTNFEKAQLIKAHFEEAFLIDANFQHTDLSGANFENASLYMPDFRGVVGLVPDQLSRAKMVVKPKLDEAFEKEIMEAYPNLLKSNYSSVSQATGEPSASRYA